MDSILEAVELSLAALIFCIAVYFFITLLGDIDRYTEEAFDYGTEIADCSYSEL